MEAMTIDGRECEVKDQVGRNAADEDMRISGLRPKDGVDRQLQDRIFVNNVGEKGILYNASQRRYYQ